VTEAVAMIRGRKHELYMESPNTPRAKKARQVKSKVKGMLIISFDNIGVFHKEFVLAGQTVNSSYYRDVKPSDTRHEIPRLEELDFPVWISLMFQRSERKLTLSLNS
jgi:hypothetical protein